MGTLCVLPLWRINVLIYWSESTRAIKRKKRENTEGLETRHRQTEQSTDTDDPSVTVAINIAGTAVDATAAAAHASFSQSQQDSCSNCETEFTKREFPL